jgi:hypothetical protein
VVCACHVQTAYKWFDPACVSAGQDQHLRSSTSSPLLKRAWVPVPIVTLYYDGRRWAAQEIRFVQMELLELSQQTELESLCSAVECMIQQDPHHAQQLPKDQSR